MGYADPDRQRDYQRRWAAERRAAFFVDQCCSDCGVGERLELHHVDPSKKVSHSIWSWGERRRRSEIDKCVVLCVDCHRKHTAAWRRIVAEERNPCGTMAAYGRGCRCEPCRTAKRTYEADRVARKLRAA